MGIGHINLSLFMDHTAQYGLAYAGSFFLTFPRYPMLYGINTGVELMDEKKLQQRLADLEAKQKTTLAILQRADFDLKVLNGAIQEVNYWLSQTKKGSEKKEDGCI